MNQELPVTIHKTAAGLFGIFALALASIGLVLWGFSSSIGVPQADKGVLFAFAVFIVALIAAFFIVWMYVYNLSYLTITEDGIVAINWKSLFTKQDVQAEWIRVQDVSVVASGFFAQMIGFGTLNIQTAGTTQALRMTMLPNVEHWQEVIAYYSDAATPDILTGQTS